MRRNDYETHNTKTLAGLVMACLLAALLSVTAFATGYDTWALAAADATNAETSGDYYVDGDDYTIYTAKGLAWFAASVNGTLSGGSADTYESKIVTLANSINLEDAGVAEGESWTPIGTSSNPFTGTFDGGDTTNHGANLYFNYTSGFSKNSELTTAFDWETDVLFSGWTIPTTYDTQLPYLGLTGEAISTFTPIYEITFDADGGTPSFASAFTGTDGTLSDLPTASFSGYTLRGWYDGDDQISTFTIFAGDTTVTASWSKNSTNTGTIVYPDGDSSTTTETATDDETDDTSDETDVTENETPVTVGGFDDVYEDDYYAEAVKWAEELGVALGTSKMEFGPTLPTS